MNRGAGLLAVLLTMWPRAWSACVAVGLALCGCSWLLPREQPQSAATVTLIRETLPLTQPFDAVLASVEPRLRAVNGRLRRRGGPDPSAKIVLVGADADVRLKPLPDGQALKFKATFQDDSTSDVAARVDAVLEAVRVAAASPAPTTVPESPQPSPAKE